MREKAKVWLNWLQGYTQADMRYLARGGFWSSVNFFTGSLLSVFLVLAFANFLDKETYGIYKYILSLTGSLSFLTLTGMNTAVIQAVAGGDENAFLRSIRIQKKWNMLYVLGAVFLSTYYFINDNHLFAYGILIVGLTFPLTVTFNTYGAYLAGKKDFKRSSIYATISNTIYIVVMVITLFLTQNILILITVYALANFLPNIYLHYKIVRDFKPARSDSGNQGLFKYSAQLSFVNIFGTLSQYVDKIVVFHYLGAVQLAVYNFALLIPERVRGYSKNVGSILLPKLAAKTVAEIAPVFYKRFWQGAFIGAVISSAYILTAPYLYKLFLPQYLESVIYSQVMSLTLIFTVPATYVGSIFYAQKMIKTIYLSSAVGHLSKIGLFIVLGALWGIWGVIFSFVLTYSLGTLYNFYLWHLEVKKFKSLKV